jgi:hypothetical protein
LQLLDLLKYSQSEAPDVVLQFHAVADLAAIYQLEGDVPAFRELTASALREYRPSPENETGQEETSPITLLAILGKMSVRLGQEDLAREIAATIRPAISEHSAYIWRVPLLVLDGELERLKGQTNSALDLLESAENLYRSTQAYESLALAHAENDDLKLAVKNLEWVAQNRGRAFVECSSSCYGRLYSLMNTTLAYANIGSLNAELGDQAAAKASFAEFNRIWPEAEASSLSVLPRPTESN